jgi:acyl-CoA reductase-like NAD-dependent aldehyde dehydrogenase
MTADTAQSTDLHFKHFIDGDWHESTSEERFGSINPYTGENWYSAALGDRSDVERAVRAARRAFEDRRWRDLTPTARGRLLRNLGDLVGEAGERLARVETTDTGKLIREMRGQLERLPEYFYYYAGLADKVQGDVIPTLQPGFLNYTLREPVGVVGAITSWNSPLLLTTMKLAPALAGGNTVVLKPSEHASASVLELMPLVAEAGFPPGVVNVVTGRGEVGAALASDPGVDKVSFTGGTEAGRHVGRAAIDHFARVTLELGGKSPQVVFADADLDAAAISIVAGIFAAAGQTCIAGSRAVVHADVHDELLERIGARARSIRLGDPLDEQTELGPLAFREQLEKVERYVAAARDEGARLVVGGSQPDEYGGWFYLPTVFADVRSDMEIAQEEIFGPILSVLRFEDEEEGVALANDSRFGLAAGVWTQQLARAHRVASRLNAGTVWINAYRTTSPLSPMGGFGDSGFGKENGTAVMQDYTRLKSVWVNTADSPPADPFVQR